MKQLDFYLTEWGLSQAESLATTFMASIYKVQLDGTTVVLKIYNSASSASDESNGKDVLQWWGGIGAVKLLRHDTNALLLEYVDGPDLTILVRNGRDDEAAAIAATVAKTLHLKNMHRRQQNLTSLEQRFAPIMQEIQADSSPLIARARDIVKSLFADPVQPHVLHGDLHQENILRHPERGWLAIDPKGMWGDRACDAASALISPSALPNIVQDTDRIKKRTSIAATILQLDERRLLSYAYLEACLIGEWSKTVGHDRDAAHHFKMAGLVGTCLDLQP